ncbi:hypothetical protein A3F00_01230 [Candidatus Daviesbacteria bacterium RIFCSPHIGHO2_12_FULL_37_11]|uniref:Uncharacterized protein n=1 Tax=Candidatus Daviesbacteria bacterium RIFCSPHIGHO2_12_FULL_37_11 TaxID=1797777 RepID=A0A1F5KA42_9BACT|nr:MAG: hypothetical protein A2111_02320 [Candidatus Daviesbacteria bacterium GWA1_38_6]OGE17671.1 MAG: hypothetical protein A2769_04115 [Candidatus Daviesbacteria bacterium RIFCSPHIGHO2_01_FULL_37_27]OGE37471.1 MAG: hypothetical protein A3F00_01230 [Candidatus Daviesbacteria bacterium RIFCSPHIGHO2_12_FULL_37_11]OGE45996.1 MAG: hypothetical protein A3B39_04300 [Candidatus Daviesbacteria bacterium RIFCSPLOWO2_01_FULL_37_10]
MESFFTKSWLRVLSGLFTNLAAGSFALVVITPNFIGIDNFTTLLTLTSDIVLGIVFITIAERLDKGVSYERDFS